MSLWIDKKYAMLLASRLERFKQKGDYLFNFRCPLCGDSKKDKTKLRGYLYRKKDALFFHCHNCHESMFFGKFIKRLDLELSRAYSMEIFSNSPKSPIINDAEEFKSNPQTEIVTQSIKLIDILPTIASLPTEHFAKRECIRRKLPIRYLNELFYTTCFKTLVDTVLPGNEKEIPVGERRLIIPFYDEKNILQGFQGRALSDSKIRYITIMLPSEGKKIFGLDKVDLTRQIPVLEGPFDSMFLDNALATMDSSLFRIAEVLGHDLKYLFIYDNEKRNTQVIRNMETTIAHGHDIFIWPKHIETKDINDLVLSGYDDYQIRELLKKRTFTGMNAKLELWRWSK